MSEIHKMLAKRVEETRLAYVHWGMTNVYNRTPEDLAIITEGYRNAEREYLEARSAYAALFYGQES